MNIDQTLEQLSHLQYPRQVDVTERVIALLLPLERRVPNSTEGSERLSTENGEHVAEVGPFSKEEDSKSLKVEESFRHLDSPFLRRVGIAAVAAVLVLLVVNVTTIYTRSYDDEGLGFMIAQANDYSSWAPVEEAAINPYEYLYEE